MRIIVWSSDVFSSDLTVARRLRHRHRPQHHLDRPGRPLPGRILRRLRTSMTETISLSHHIAGRSVTGAAAFEQRNPARPDNLRVEGPEAAPNLAMEAAEAGRIAVGRSEEHTSELQSLMRTSYAVFCLKKKTQK